LQKLGRCQTVQNIFFPGEPYWDRTHFFFFFRRFGRSPALKLANLRARCVLAPPAGNAKIAPNPAANGEVYFFQFIAPLTRTGGEPCNGSPPVSTPHGAFFFSGFEREMGKSRPAGGSNSRLPGSTPPHLFFGPPPSFTKTQREKIAAEFLPRISMPSAPRGPKPRPKPVNNGPREKPTRCQTNSRVLRAGFYTFQLPPVSNRPGLANSRKKITISPLKDPELPGGKRRPGPQDCTSTMDRFFSTPVPRRARDRKTAKKLKGGTP